MALLENDNDYRLSDYNSRRVAAELFIWKFYFLFLQILEREGSN